MSREVEAIFYFGFMGFAFFVVTGYSLWRIKQTRDFKKTLIEFIVLDLLVFALGALCWFIYASDGFSQIFGILYYGVAFIITLIVNIIVLVIRRNK